MSPRSSTIHGLLALVWALLAVPTVLVWRESIMWVALISVYANFVTHWGAWESARAKENTEGRAS